MVSRVGCDSLRKQRSVVSVLVNLRTQMSVAVGRDSVGVDVTIGKSNPVSTIQVGLASPFGRFLLSGVHEGIVRRYMVEVCA